jgi:hypothetical protein
MKSEPGCFLNMLLLCQHSLVGWNGRLCSKHQLRANVPWNQQVALSHPSWGQTISRLKTAYLPIMRG